MNVTSDAAVEPYAGWGGYGSAKAALDHVTAILAAEQPALRVYAFDPGDMRTELQQQAFPGEDIWDRPSPEQSLPAVLELIEGLGRAGATLPPTCSRPGHDRGCSYWAARGARASRGLRLRPGRRGDARRRSARGIARPRSLRRPAEVPLARRPARGEHLRDLARRPARTARGTRGRASAVDTRRLRLLDRRAPDQGRGAAPAAARGRPGRASGRSARRRARTVPRQRAPVARPARAGRAARGVPVPPRSPHPLRLRQGRMAARCVSDGVRNRAGQRRDAERGPSLHDRTRNRAGGTRRSARPDHAPHRRLLSRARRAAVPRAVPRAPWRRPGS